MGRKRIDRPLIPKKPRKPCTYPNCHRMSEPGKRYCMGCQSVIFMKAKQSGYFQDLS